GLQLARQQLHEDALTLSVAADHTDPLTAHHGQVDAGQDPPPAEVGVDAVQLDHALAAALRTAQPEGHLASLQHRPLDLLHPVDLALLVARLANVALVGDPAGPQLEPADRLLEPGDLLLLGHVLLLLALQLELPLGGVRGVVARPDPDPAAVQLGD